MNHPKEGFAAVASWIALDPDSETFVFRKFDELSARNLLYMQARISVLERKLKAMDKEVSQSDDMTVKDGARTWEVLVEQSGDGAPGARRQMELIDEIGDALKKYHEVLVLQSQVAALHRPNKRILQAFRHWFSKPFPALGGLCKNFLDNENDLVALKTPPDLDYLSKSLREHWPAKKEPARDGALEIGRFNETSVSLTVNIISVLVAAVLLVGSITGFYFVTAPLAKLGMIAGWTAIFALSVGIMTNARRAELFAATAAYAAVLVVFVSNGDLVGSQNCPTDCPVGGIR